MNDTKEFIKFLRSLPKRINFKNVTLDDLEWMYELAKQLVNSKYQVMVKVLLELLDRNITDLEKLKNLV